MRTRSILPGRAQTAARPPLAPRGRPGRTLMAVFAAALLATGPAGAQAVHGRVVEPGTAEPVPGAVVVLLDGGGARAAATLSDAQGAYALRAGAPGTYTVRAERVGYAAASSPPLALAVGGEVEQALVLQPRQVSLEPLLVRGTQRACTLRPQAEAAVVWEELRKALDAAAVADQRRRHAFRKRLFRRERTLVDRRLTCPGKPPPRHLGPCPSEKCGCRPLAGSIPLYQAGLYRGRSARRSGTATTRHLREKQLTDGRAGANLRKNP